MDKWVQWVLVAGAVYVHCLPNSKPYINFSPLCSTRYNLRILLNS